MSYKITKNYLTPGTKPRGGEKLKSVNGIALHWIAAGQESAMVIRNNFENAGGYASTQFIIGYKGEIVQCMDEREVAWHVGAKTYRPAKLNVTKNGNPNYYMIGIELCTTPEDCYLTNRRIPSDYNNKSKYPNMGRPGPTQYQITVEFVGDLCKKYNLDPLTDIYIHYDMTGKLCHIYYVNNPDKFKQFKLDVKSYMNTGKSEVKPAVKVDPDIPSPYAEGAIAKAKTKGVISGSGNGVYNYRNFISRQDICCMLDRLGLLPESKPGYSINKVKNHVAGYAEEAVRRAYSNGVINGMPDGYMKLQEGVTRQDICCIFDNMGVLKTNDSKYDFMRTASTEVDNIPSPYASLAVAKALNSKLIVGDQKGDFKLKSMVSRQDFIVFMDRLGLLD